MHSPKFLFPYLTLVLGLQGGPAFAILWAEVLLCPVEMCFALINSCLEGMFIVDNEGSETSFFAFKEQSDAKALLWKRSCERLEHFWTNRVEGAVRVFASRFVPMHLITSPFSVSGARKDFKIIPSDTPFRENFCLIESDQGSFQVDLIVFFQAIKKALMDEKNE